MQEEAGREGKGREEKRAGEKLSVPPIRFVESALPYRARHTGLLSLFTAFDLG